MGQLEDGAHLPCWSVSTATATDLRHTLAYTLGRWDTGRQFELTVPSDSAFRRGTAIWRTYQASSMSSHP